MVTHRLALLGLLGALLIPGLAWAEDGEPLRERRMQEIRYETSVPQHGGNTFTRLDTNGDGRISAAEAGNRPLPDSFWILDRNRDGSLTPQEYRYRPI